MSERSDKEWNELVLRIAMFISYGQTRDVTYTALRAYGLSNEQAYLTYVAAKLWVKWME